MSNPLGFKVLTDALAGVFDTQPDLWRAKDQPEKVSYSLSDAGLATFSVFFTQSPSFLAYQRDMAKRKGTSNAHTLFGMGSIPLTPILGNPRITCLTLLLLSRYSCPFDRYIENLSR